MDLGDLVSPLAQDTFLGQVFGREIRTFAGHPGRFAKLLSWPALNEILRHHRLQSPRLRLMRNGAPIDEDSYTTRMRGTFEDDRYRQLRPGALAEQLRSGATLVVDSIDELHAPVGDLAVALERRLGEPVAASAYASWGAAAGFGVHWDDHDVVVIQLTGRKRWRVHGPSRPWPLHRDVEPNTTPPAELLADVTLTDGDVLHVPRGWWHAVSALDEPTLHLTFGITRRTGIDLMAWLTDELRGDPRFRQDLPRYADGEVLADHVATLRAKILKALDDKSLTTRFFAAQDADAPSRPRLSLPHAATTEILPDDEESLVVLLAPRARLDDHGTSVTLTADGRRWAFNTMAAPVLRRLLDDGDPATLHELCALTDPRLECATVRAFVAELVTAGLVAVNTPD